MSGEEKNIEATAPPVANAVPPAETIRRNAEKISLGNWKRHIFLCTGPKCVDEERGMTAWEVLKGATRACSNSAPGAPATVGRTKVGCLRVCADGPIAVVYPEGIWYRRVEGEACERIVKEHLIGGKPVEEFILGKHPLKG